MTRIGWAVVFFAAALPRPSEAEPTFGEVEIHASRPNTIPGMRSRFFRGRYEARDATVEDPGIANPLASKLIACSNMTLGQFTSELDTIRGLKLQARKVMGQVLAIDRVSEKPSEN